VGRVKEETEAGTLLGLPAPPIEGNSRSEEVSFQHSTFLSAKYTCLQMLSAKSVNLVTFIKPTGSI
jgi:hypothetical protein